MGFNLHCRPLTTEKAILIASNEPLSLPFVSAIPFVLLLLGIAILPLIAGRWWHSNRNKAIVSLVLAAPVCIYLLVIGPQTNGESTHHLLHEIEAYFSFIFMLTALYTIAGGILLVCDLPAAPRVNTAILAIGACLANVIGTTGASILLIRPLLRINHRRRHTRHVPLFFIFLVSNTGGLLTPLGDPPLFLGFLAGVDFTWTLTLWKEWLILNSLLLAVFYIWDRLAYSRETPENQTTDVKHFHSLRIVGWFVNGPLLLGVLVVIMLESPSFGSALGRLFGGFDFTLASPWSEAVLAGLIGLSLLLTPRILRQHNRFSWFPMIEVAVLFAGIFVTMVPALILLRQHGSELNINQPWQWYWLTGILSSFLDNAPTYLTFATLAAGEHGIGWLAGNRPAILGAISCGAVFMGALTYIGNGPNFMVKAIAEETGFPMPSFFGYLLYSSLILLPLFAVITILFFV